MILSETPYALLAHCQMPSWSLWSPCVRGRSISQQCCIRWISSRHAPSSTTEIRLFKSQPFTNRLNKTLQPCRLSFFGSFISLFSSTHRWRGLLAPGSWVSVSLGHMLNAMSSRGLSRFSRIWWHCGLFFSWWIGVHYQLVEDSLLGRFSSSWNCCAHLATCPLSVSKVFPFLSFTGTERLEYEPNSCFDYMPF